MFASDLRSLKKVGRSDYSAAKRIVSRDSSSILRMSQTQRAHWAALSQALKICAGFVAPAAIAART